MEYHSIRYDDIPQDLPAVSACIGFFDGIHIGHQQLIHEAVNCAQRNHLVPALITFAPDPWVVLKGQHDIPHLTNRKQRILISEKLGIEHYYEIQFTRELADLGPDDFVRKVLLPLQVRVLVCGFDYTYGSLGKGKASDLSSYCEFTTRIIEQVSYAGEKISSTRIENAVRNGDMKMAMELLGRPYWMQGTVIHGRHVGRTIGFPTLNLQTDGIYVLPCIAVYAGAVRIHGQVYQAMINIGHNSAFNAYKNLSLEVHVLDFDQDVYGENVDLFWGAMIRTEMNFNDVSALQTQLKKDEDRIRDYFSSPDGLWYNKLKE